MKLLFKLFFLLLQILISASIITCRSFEHTNPLDPEYEGASINLPETTEILTEDDFSSGNATVSDDSSAIILDPDIAENYDVGDVVVVTEGEGMLKKIVEMHTENGKVVASIEDASLVEAVEEATTSFDSAFATISVASIETYEEDDLLKLNKAATPDNPMSTYDINVILYDKDGNKNTTGDQTRLHGQFHMDQTIRGDLEIKAWSVKRFMLEYEINQNLDLNCEIALINATGNWEYTKEKPLAKVTYTPITVPAGPVPVIIVPVLEFVVGIELSVGATVKTGISQSFQYSMGIEYANSQWTPYHNIETDFSFVPPELEGSATVRAYLRPELKFKIYGTVAPKIYAELAGIAEGTVVVPSYDLNGKLAVDFAAGAGVDMKILDHSFFDYKADIIEGEWVIYEWTNHADLPDAPTLHVPSNNQIINEIRPLFDWSDEEDAVSYEFEYNTQNSFSSTTPINVTDSDYRITQDLTNGTYYWHVRGIDSEDRPGAWSSIWQFTIDTNGPSELALHSPLDNAFLTDNTPLLDWSDATDATNYELIVDNNSDFSSPVITQSSLSQSEYTPSTPLADDSYFWCVRAQDAVGNWSSYTDYRTFTIDTEPPAVPVLNSPSNNTTLTTGSVVFDWSDAMENDVTFEIKVDNNNQFNQPEIHETDLTSSNFSTSSDLTDATYYWQVRAHDLAGNTSEWSAERQFAIDTQGPIPPILASPSFGEIITDLTPTLQWNAADDAVTHELQVSTLENFSSTQIHATLLTDSAYTFTVELSENTYYWRVRSTDNIGNQGNWSVTSEFTVQAPVPDPPVLISPENNSVISDNTPTLDWSDVASASEYFVEVTGRNLYLFSYTSTSEYTPSTFPDGTYNWHVKVKTDLNRWSEWSTLWSFTVNTELTKKLTGIVISPSTATVFNNQTQRFTCTATYSNKTTENISSSTSWSLSSGSIGSIDASGLFTAHSSNIGTETITATYQGETVQAIITVESDDTETGTVIFYGVPHKIVKIGSQWWLAENLKVTRYRNGDPIPEETDNSTWANLTTGARCAYNNNASNESNTYGYLYNWYAVISSANIAPEGWHVPNDEEWKTLEKELGMSQSEVDDSREWRGSNEGSKLAGRADLWNTGSLKNNAAFDESNFSALPAGCREYSSGMFQLLNSMAIFWSATGTSNNGLDRRLHFNLSNVGREVSYGAYGLSIRLVKD